MSLNTLRLEVEALDAEQGYLLRGKMTINGERTEIAEHYDTEADLRTRLGTGFDIWAAQVDAEPIP
jgi:hypothetical protein